MKIAFFIFLQCSLCFVFAQDAKTDFKKINQVYFNLDKISMDVTYELFFDNDTKPSDKETGFYKRNQNSYYTKQTNNELLINNKYMVVIDNDDRTIILDKAKDKIVPLNLINVNLDSIFYFYSKVEFFKTGKNKEFFGYIFTLKKGPYSQVEVVFNPVTFLICEITNTYREKMADENDVMHYAKLKTIFSNINTKPNFKNEFKESKYVTGAKQSIKLTPSYSNYKLLTNLKKL